MFCCDECHDARKHPTGYRSLGRCEVCGKMAACIDCHNMTCDPPKKATRRGEDA